MHLFLLFFVMFSTISLWSYFIDVLLYMTNCFYKKQQLQINLLDQIYEYKIK